MYLYVYIYIYRMYTYIYTYTCIYIYKFVYTYTHIYIYRIYIGQCVEFMYLRLNKLTPPVYCSRMEYVFMFCEAHSTTPTCISRRCGCQRVETVLRKKKACMTNQHESKERHGSQRGITDL